MRREKISKRPLPPMLPPPKCKVCGEDEYLTILKQTDTHIQLGCLNCKIIKEENENSSENID
jgi:hypothetical protein